MSHIGYSEEYLKGHAVGYHDGYIDGIKIVPSLVNKSLHPTPVILPKGTVFLNNKESAKTDTQQLKDAISSALDLLKSVNADDSDSYHHLNNAIIALESAPV